MNFGSLSLNIAPLFRLWNKLLFQVELGADATKWKLDDILECHKFSFKAGTENRL